MPLRHFGGALGALVVAIEVDEQEGDARRLVEQHVGIVAVLAVGEMDAGADVFEPAGELERQAARHVQAADEDAVGLGEGIDGLIPERLGGEVVGRGDRRLLRGEAVMQGEMRRFALGKGLVAPVDRPKTAASGP